MEETRAARSAGSDISLRARREMRVSGVEEVISFDDTAVILRTQLGKLMIHGKELQLKTDLFEGNNTEMDARFNITVSFRLDPETNLPIFCGKESESLTG